ncbi:MAG: BtpA/SgcQ family protein [Bradymonadia bacterium]
MSAQKYTHHLPRLVGMVHLPPLPGAPLYAGDFEDVLKRAQRDARALVASGFDGLMIENYGDVPFFADRVPAITIAAMARIASHIIADHPATKVGINVLRNDAISALSIAQACDAQFIRVNVLAGTSVTDQGIIQSQAAELLRIRQAWRSQVAILADVGVKHAAPLGLSDLGQVAQDTYHRGLADGLIVSGSATGAATSVSDIETVKTAVPGCPVYIGSGVTEDNFDPTSADGFIIGTSLKTGGVVSEEKAKRIVDAATSG